MRGQIERLGLPYLLEEILQVIEAWAIDSPEAYFSHERKGRGTAIKLPLRQAIWLIYQKWQKLMLENRFTTWEQLRCQALEIARRLSHSPYQAIIIDEAQDLSPASLRFLLCLVNSFEGLYLTADASQSLYQRGFTWKQIHADLKVTGRTLLLKRNYRNTQQIAKACAGILEGTTAGDQDCLQEIFCSFQSDLPILLQEEDRERQIVNIKDFFLNSARNFQLPLHGGALLCFNNYAAKEYANKLTQLGLTARFISGKEIDIKAPYIKILTIHSAKGLEFPFVVLTDLAAEYTRILSTIAADEVPSHLEAYYRLLYVGCSRAMRALMICGAHSSEVLKVFKDTYWQKQ